MFQNAKLDLEMTVNCCCLKNQRVSCAKYIMLLPQQSKHGVTVGRVGRFGNDSKLRFYTMLFKSACSQSIVGN